MCNSFISSFRSFRLRKLEVFHMHSQRMILGIRWYDFVRNTEVVDLTNRACVQDIIAKRWNSLFDHVMRLDDHTPVHRTLSQVVAARTGLRFGPGWQRWPGPPRHSWVQQIGDGTPFSIRSEWSKARHRGHSGLTQRTSAVYAIWWWWWFISLSTTSYHVLLDLRFCLPRSASKVTHFFIQSLSSFLKTCPYHHSLYCHTTFSMSHIPYICLNLMQGSLPYVFLYFTTYSVDTVDCVQAFVMCDVAVSLRYCQYVSKTGSRLHALPMRRIEPHWNAFGTSSCWRVRNFSLSTADVVTSMCWLNDPNTSQFSRRPM